MVAHGQVAAFDQAQAQVAGQVGVLEVGFVVRAGCQQGNAGGRAVGGHDLDAVNECLVAGSQALHLHAHEGLGKLAGNGDAVFEQVAQAGRGLGALRHHAPAAIGAARQVKGGDVEPGVAQGLDSVQRTQVAGVALDQGRWQQTAAQQLTGAVDVGHDEVEQTGALQHTGFDAGPAFRGDDGGQQVQRPGALHALGGIGIDVVGHAVVADLPGQALRPAVEFAHALQADVPEKIGPVRTQALAVGLAQFVQVAGRGFKRPILGQRRRVRRGGGRKEGQGKFAHDLSMQRMYAIRVYPMRSGNHAVGHCGAASG